MAVLTESKDPLAYWRKLKQRLKAEGNETVTNCHGLKLRAADGKMRIQALQGIEKSQPFSTWQSRSPSRSPGTECFEGPRNREKSACEGSGNRDIICAVPR